MRQNEILIPPFPGPKRGKRSTFAPASSQSISPGRRIAQDVLLAVEAGGYASDSLREATVGLDGRDAALANQIVFGALRFRAQLDFLIQNYSGRRAESLHEPVRQILRGALYQLRYLERIPHHAAVHDAVELTKVHRRSAAGLVNAVLRKVNREPVEWPDLATRLSCPDWLLTRWTEHFGADVANEIGQAFLQQPVAYVRVPPGEPLPAGVDLKPTDVAGAWQLAGQNTSQLRLHDIGSQSVLPALAVSAEHRYLDLCAAPGNKTRQALEARPTLAVACDVSESRLSAMDPICPRLVLDGTRPLPFPPETFDRIFIDAPCSGTGTIGRNPEIKWRVQRSDLAGFAARQTRLIENAAPLLRPGGRLLSATCSMEREENEDVVADACRTAGLNRLEEHWRIPGREKGDGFYSALLARQS